MNSTVTKRNASCPRCRCALSEDVDSGYAYHWWRCDACGFVWIAELGPRLRPGISARCETRGRGPGPSAHVARHVTEECPPQHTALPASART